MDPTFEYATKVVNREILAGPLVRAACQRHLDDLERSKLAVWNYYFDEKAAAKAIGFFPDMLVFTDGRNAGQPFILELWQQFVVGSIFGWKKKSDGFRRFRNAYVEIGKGNGKALAVDTPVPTPEGWSTMGALRVGDRVFDENGEPCNVIAVTDVMYDHECYRLTFDDGSSIVADAEHLWYTEMRRHGTERGGALVGIPRNQRGSWRRGLRTTKEIANTLRYANGQFLSANHSIPLALPVNTYQEAETLKIAPYVLGVWLGDGDSDCGRITQADCDVEILDRIAECGYALNKPTKVKENSAAVSIVGLQKQLNEEGLLHNKHIPLKYLRGSIAQRLALLQGLMDTDGYIAPSGACEYCSTNERLANNVLELARSLGIKATVNVNEARLYGKFVSYRWRVIFQAPELPVFKLKRKLQHQFNRHNRRKLSADRRIVDCVKVASVPVKCISVDSPNRMYLASEAFIPTHNSPLAGGIGLIGLVADGEAGAEIYAAATKLEQAKILFRDAQRMAEASPVLGRLITHHQNNLSVIKTHSFFRPISSEKRGLDGPRVHMGLIDELHEHQDAIVVNKIRAGTKGRRQALIFEITNSGYDKTTVCWAHREYTEKVLLGHENNDSWFGYICGLDPDDDWMNDEGCWIKANPNLGVSITLEYLREQVNEARGMPSKQSLVARLNFCTWVGAENPWITPERWMECQGSFTLDDVRGWYAYLAADLSATKDLTALGAVFVNPDDLEERRGMVWFFTPKDTLVERSREDRVGYDIWANAGELIATPGRLVDYKYVVQKVGEVLANCDVQGLAYDPWRMDVLIKEFEAQGIVAYKWEGPDKPEGSGLRLVKHGQQFTGANAEDSLWMPRSVEVLEEWVLKKKIMLRKNPVLDWCSANAVLTPDPAGNRKWDKRKATGRIDGIVALSMAAGLAASEQERNESYLEHEGVLLL